MIHNHKTQGPLAIKINLVFYVMLSVIALLLHVAFTYRAMAEDDIAFDRRLDKTIDERIDCNAPDGYFEVRAVIPDGEYENIALLQSGIMMCGWTTNRFEMFVYERKGCFVKKQHRWWMNNKDAMKVRECFRQ